MSLLNKYALRIFAIVCCISFGTFFVSLGDTFAQELLCQTEAKSRYGEDAFISFGCVTSAMCGEGGNDEIMFDAIPNTKECGEVNVCCVKLDKVKALEFANNKETGGVGKSCVVKQDNVDRTGLCKATCGEGELATKSGTGGCNSKTRCCFGAIVTTPGSSGSPTTLFNPLGEGTTLYTVMRRVIQAFLGLFGAGALVVMFYAGAVWMTAGSSTRVEQSKETMKYAAIGLCIIAFAYAISGFAIKVLVGNITPPQRAPVVLPAPPPPNP